MKLTIVKASKFHAQIFVNIEIKRKDLSYIVRQNVPDDCQPAPKQYIYRDQQYSKIYAVMHHFHSTVTHIALTKGLQQHLWSF